jgi:hypothetical protein
MGQWPHGAAQFFVDGQYVRAGSDNGPIVFNIRDNGNHISIGDGMGQSHHLSTFEKGDRMALAATACAWLGDMSLRNPGADVVDGGDYEHRINGPAYRDDVDYTLTRGKGNVPWENRAVPDDLIAKFGKDNLSPDANRRLMQARAPATANKRYDWCGDSQALQREEALKEAEELAIAAGLDRFEFDGKTMGVGNPWDNYVVQDSEPCKVFDHPDQDSLGWGGMIAAFLFMSTLVFLFMLFMGRFS